MEVEQKNSKLLCSACERELSGSAYCCTEPHCNFNLHKACFECPREIRHKSHLEHSLTLVAVSRYSEGRFTCDACGKDGKGFSYSCATCLYDIHMDCVKWPETMTRRDDKHPLTLSYSSAAALGNEMTFTCDVCKNPVDKMGWLYNCRECDFGTHLECVSSEVKQQTVGDGLTLEQLRIDKKVQKAILELWDSDSDSD
ncbi:hypothetical protein DH2020_002711 [Rehmannia glutinosa]|uniref:DC1 domain-containing protein n=1 Tax=Rehmannia glutinosa TaxID=99300 RepID=A0ABR0XUY0_REHGL